MLINYIGHTSKLDMDVSIYNLFPLRTFIKWCMLLNQKQICPPHFTYIPYMSYLSGAYMGDICSIYKSLATNMWTVALYKTLPTTFHVTGIHHWTHMAATNLGHTALILIGNTDLTLVHKWCKTQQTTTYTPHVAIYVPAKLYTCAIYITNLMGLYGGCIMNNNIFLTNNPKARKRGSVSWGSNPHLLQSGQVPKPFGSPTLHSSTCL